MSERQQFLGTVPLFATLAPDELSIVAEMVTAVGWEAGADVFSMGDAGDSMFAVEEGVVEVYTVVSGIEKLFMTVRAGGVFGLLSLIDSGDAMIYFWSLDTSVPYNEVVTQNHSDVEGLAQCL
jgi:CRP-like cAMP-binding protein